MVSILVAYLVKTDRRDLLPRIWLGVGSLSRSRSAFGFALTYGPRGLTFEAQEPIGGTLSIIAVAFVTWMIFWMARAARASAGELRGQIDEAAEGKLVAWSLVAMLAVGREGLETALFLWAATEAAARDADGRPGSRCSAPRSASRRPWCSATCIYRGAISINLSRFFPWTGAS